MELDEYLELIMKSEKEIQYPHSMYYSEGMKYLHLRRYEKAVSFLDLALQKDPMHVNSWLKRSESFLGLKQYGKAKEDAMEAMKLNPLSTRAIDLKGQAEYLMGDFENGYLTYLKGQSLIPGSDKLRLGKQLCQEAMYNSLRPVRGMTVTTDDLALLRKLSDDEFKQHVSGLQGRQATYERFLSDTKFLEALLSDKCLKSVHNLCKEAMQYIENSQRFWSMQMPLHTRKKIPKIPRKAVIKPEMSIEVFICKAAKRRCYWDLEKGRVNSCITEVHKMLERMKSIPDKFSQDKFKLKGDALHLLSLAYQQENNHSLFLRYLNQELELANDHGLIFIKIRALHHLGSYYLKSGNLQKAYFCLENIMSTLNFSEIGKFSELTDILEDEHLKEFKAAKKWTDEFISNLQEYIQDEIISPAIKLAVEDATETSQNASRSECVYTDIERTLSNSTDFGDRTTSPSPVQDSEEILPTTSTADNTVCEKLSDEYIHENNTTLAQLENQLSEKREIGSDIKFEVPAKYPQMDDSTSHKNKSEFKDLEETSANESDSAEKDRSESQMSDKRSEISTEVDETSENSE